MPDINATLPAAYVRTLPTQESVQAQDQQISANLLHGLEAQQRNRQITMQEQQQAAMLPLQVEQMKNQLSLQSIAISNGLQQQADDVETANAVSSMSSYLQRAFRAGLGGEPQTEAGMYSIIKKYPKAAASPAVRDMFMQLKIAQSADQAESMAQFKADQAAAERGAVQAALTQRAEMGAEARIQAANISAQARIQAAMERATHWNDHAKFAAFKAMATRIASDKTITDDNEAARRIEEAEQRFAPGQSGVTPALTPAPPGGKRTLKWNPVTKRLE